MRSLVTMHGSAGRAALSGAFLGLFFCLFFCVLSGASRAASDADAGVVDARVVQQELPALGARRQSAEARAEAGLRWFAGQAALGEAFVDLAGAPLDHDGYVAAALAGLDERATERAAWRVQAPPDGLSPDLARRWRDERDRAATAEDQADELERRFLVGVRSVLSRAPLLEASQTAELRARWTEVMAGLPPVDSPDRAAALSRAAAAGDALAALDRYLDAAWRAGSIPGDDALISLVDADLAAGEAEAAAAVDGAAVDAAATARLDRLRRVRPLLDPARQDRIDAIRQRSELARLRVELPQARQALAELRTQLEQPAAPGDDADALQAQIAALDAQREALVPVSEPPADASELDRLRAELDGIGRERLELRRALLTRQLEATRRDASAAASAAREEDARRRASEARAAAEEADDSQVAAARAQLAQLEEELAGWIQAERSRHAAAVARLDALGEQLAKVSADADAALSRPVLDIGRDAAIDAAYRSARGLVLDLRQALADADGVLASVDEQDAQRRQRLPDRAVIGDAGDLAIADLVELHREERADASEELDRVVALLGQGKKLRRRLRRLASASASAETRSAFLPELMREMSEAPLVVRADLRATWRVVRALPARVTDLNAIAAFLLQSFEIVVLAVLWVLLRRNAEDIGRRLLALVWAQQQDGAGSAAARRLAQVGWFVPGDARALAAPLAPLLFAGVDASIAWFFFDMTRDALPLLALLFYGWLARTIYRGAPAGVGLLFATPDVQRPALRIVSPRTIALLERSVRLVVGLSLLVWFLDFVALDLFDADRLADLVGIFRTGAAVVALCWLLLSWAEHVRRAVAGLGGLEGASARLVDEGGGVVTRLLRSGAGVGWLVWRGTAELVVRVAEGRPGLGWLASAFARARLRKTADSPAASRTLDASDRAALEASALPVPRDKELAALDEALTAWADERRRGMLAVIGDRGMGRPQVIREVARRALELDPKLTVQHLVLGGRTHDPDAALVWLARSTGCSDISVTEEGLVSALAAMPRTLFVIDELQRLALRAVGGFGAVHAVLRVMQATSEEHLWVCGVHGATWGYLAGVTSSVNLEAFRCAVVLDGLTATDLGDWITRRVATAGFELRFDALLPPGAAIADREQAVARAERAFWRLLVDASKGNPEIAWIFVLDSLCCSSRSGAVEVAMFEAPTAASLEKLTDLDLFVLTAVVMHDELDTESVAEVLNASLAKVQEACRHLEGLDVLAGPRDGSGWIIEPAWWPAVLRVLRQKHFLYMG